MRLTEKELKYIHNWFKKTGKRQYDWSDNKINSITNREVKISTSKPHRLWYKYGLPRELQSAGKFRNAYDDLDTIARLMFGKPYKKLTPAQQERARAKNKTIYPDRNVIIMHSKKLKKVA
jgi:hypothetical protein